MKATELRIGNYLMDDESDTLVVVSRIESIEYTNWNSGDEFNIVVLEYGTKERYLEGDFRPIPITEEWLLNLGFTLYNKENPIMFKGVVFIEQRQKTLIGTQFFTFHFDGNTIKIQYVHQLQNLYFALTNEELNLKSE